MGVCAPFNKQSGLTADRFKDVADGGRASPEGLIRNSVYTSTADAGMVEQNVSRAFDVTFAAALGGAHQLPLSLFYLPPHSSPSRFIFSLPVHPFCPFLLTIAKAVLQNSCAGLSNQPILLFTIML